MKRPSNSGDDEENRFPLAADELFSSSPARRIGETIIQFPGPAASAGDQEDAGVSSASASSTFVPLGSAIRPVILRLKGRFPRISMPARLREEEDAAAPADQSAEERD
ncbi:hypothetical protein [Shinella sp.]|uniref:hypothetical protein n=1 Tax=Shinella sp. TaxID=1870904 RepID=UPI003D27FE0E